MWPHRETVAESQGMSNSWSELKDSICLETWRVADAKDKQSEMLFPFTQVPKPELKGAFYDDLFPGSMIN